MASGIFAFSDTCLLRETEKRRNSLLFFNQSEVKQVHDGDLFNENGMPKREFPDHWKGKESLYSVGFGRQGLAGISRDAQNIAKDIDSLVFRRSMNKLSC